MDFGKLQDISGVDFSLAEDADRNKQVLQSGTSSEKPKIYIGSARWGERNLLDKLYPAATPSRDFLYHYSRQFNTVELNTTHYRIPSTDMVEQWREKASPDFRFCPKIPQVISHRKDFGRSINATPDFLEALYAFGDQLGMPFMQLPPTFSPHRDGKALFSYLQEWPQDLPLAVEFRHPDWFSDPRISRRAFDLLQEYGLSTVITDTAGRRDVVHMQVTSPRQAVRFVGNSLHPTDYSRLDSWVERIGRWLDYGLEELYFFVHQPEEYLCVDLAVYLIHQMNQRLELNLQPPKPVSKGIQKSLF
jgi:uncharacterized protein YecE (DUF72 family)